MAHPGFEHLWRQEEMSDVEIVISVADDMAPAGDETPKAQNSASTRTLLQQFPGHTTILSLSPYFVAQALRWVSPPQPQSSSQPGSASDTCTCTASSTQQAKKQVNITLPHASYEPAAMAVLAGLYQVQPWPVLLADLTPQQQVQAAVLADMWQLPAASEAAVAALQQTLEKADTSYFRRQHEAQVIAVLDQLLSLAAVPDGLLPVFERAVLCRYGDLEAVWDPGAALGASLRESLLALPLYAIELLLASNKLQVASEDTVLFTAQAYVDNLAAAGHVTQQAVNRLAPLVRCPHLSQFWLSASVLSDDAPRMLLGALQPQLRRLMLLKQARSSSSANRSMQLSSSLDDTHLQDLIPATPDSWLLPPRLAISNMSRGSVSWHLNVAEIKQAAQDSANQQGVISLRSPDSCLVGGVMWGMELRCSWDASKQGSTIGLFARASSLPAGSICMCTYQFHVIGAPTEGEPQRQLICADWETDYFGGDHADARGLPDVFGLGAMAGGFDEAAWAARGLPAYDAPGSVFKLLLGVKDVGV